MSVRLSILLRNLIVLAIAMALAVAFAPGASANTADETSCADQWAEDDDDFFGRNPGTITVISSSTQPDSREAAAEVVQHLNKFYTNTNTQISTDQGESTDKTVLVDGDVAVPGQAQVFSVGGVETLYLHWTTAVDDLDQRLEAAPNPTCSARGEVTAAIETDIDVRNDPDPAGNLLAYVEESSNSATPSPPIGSQSPNLAWHLPALAASGAAFSAAGIRRHLRVPEGAATEPPVAMDTSAPRYPVADLPPHPNPATLPAAPKYPVADLPPTNL